MSEKIRVVLAEDDPGITEVVKLYADTDPRFELVGTVADGISAIGAVERQRPDALILDLCMPGANGVSVLPEVRERYPDVKVIVHSSLPLQSASLLRRGATAHVDKMAGVERVFETIARLCEVATVPDPVGS